MMINRPHTTFAGIDFQHITIPEPENITLNHPSKKKRVCNCLFLEKISKLVKKFLLIGESFEEQMQSEKKKFPTLESHFKRALSSKSLNTLFYHSIEKNPIKKLNDLIQLEVALFNIEEDDDLSKISKKITKNHNDQQTETKNDTTEEKTTRELKKVISKIISYETKRKKILEKINRSLPHESINSELLERSEEPLEDLEPVIVVEENDDSFSSETSEESVEDSSFSNKNIFLELKTTLSKIDSDQSLSNPHNQEKIAEAMLKIEPYLPGDAAFDTLYHTLPPFEAKKLIKIYNLLKLSKRSYIESRCYSYINSKKNLHIFKIILIKILPVAIPLILSIGLTIFSFIKGNFTWLSTGFTVLSSLATLFQLYKIIRSIQAYLQAYSKYLEGLNKYFQTPKSTMLIERSDDAEEDKSENEEPQRREEIVVIEESE